MQPEYQAHESVYRDEGAQVGKDTQIWHFSHIMSGAKIGERCKIGQNVVVGHAAVLGNNVKVQNNVSIYDGVTLEDDVFCGPSMVFTNIFNPRSAIPRNTAEHWRRTLVKQGASIGANATVVCGNTIGRYAFIGAGSVVTKDIPDYALVYGNPARQQGWVCECGVKLNFGNGKAVCQACGRNYQKAESGIKRV